MHRLLVLTLLFALLLPDTADAFCGFFVSPGDTKLVNNATRVALMRHGDKTVTTLQPDYEGPAEDFAMVIPVPEVVQKDQVKTLERTLFDELDAFTSPRMAEYWEEDPCMKPPVETGNAALLATSSGLKTMARTAGETKEPYVRVEAKFAVGEYDIVVLSSNEAAALESWLKKKKYKIPAGAAPYLAPYINSGMYFFVAKVDPKRAMLDGKRAVLSPLRFHYTSEDFTLPIRLGMINAKKEQDILVFVFGQERYVPSNYPTAPIPTNIVVDEKVKKNFAGFYEGLFSRTRAENEGAIVTEHVWPAVRIDRRRGRVVEGQKCDPCTGPVMNFKPQWALSLGLDVFGIGGRRDSEERPAPTAPSKLVVTRLHGRFKAGKSTADIMFQKAGPLNGGLGMPDSSGQLPATTHSGFQSLFQGRYVILNHWKGELACEAPVRGRWGGSPMLGTSPPTVSTAPQFASKRPKAIDPGKYAKTPIQYAPPEF